MNKEPSTSPDLVQFFGSDTGLVVVVILLAILAVAVYVKERAPRADSSSRSPEQQPTPSSDDGREPEPKKEKPKPEPKPRLSDEDKARAAFRALPFDKRWAAYRAHCEENNDKVMSDSIWNTAREPDADRSRIGVFWEQFVNWLQEQSGEAVDSDETWKQMTAFAQRVSAEAKSKRDRVKGSSTDVPTEGRKSTTLREHLGGEGGEPEPEKVVVATFEAPTPETQVVEVVTPETIIVIEPTAAEPPAVVAEEAAVAMASPAEAEPETLPEPAAPAQAEALEPKPAEGDSQ